MIEREAHKVGNQEKENPEITIIMQEQSFQVL